MPAEILIREYHEGDHEAMSQIIMDNDHVDRMDWRRHRQFKQFHTPENLLRLNRAYDPDILMAEIDETPVGTIVRLQDRFWRLHVARHAIRQRIGTLLLQEMILRCNKEGYEEAYGHTLTESTAEFLDFLKATGVEIISVDPIVNKEGAVKIRFKTTLN